MNTTKIQAGNTIVYVEGDREWTAEVQSIAGETLTVRTVSDAGDYSEPHTLPVADVVRVAAA